MSTTANTTIRNVTSGPKLGPTPEAFGIAIGQLRRQGGLGLRELARRANLSAGALSAIERGQSSPTLATLHKLLNALGTDFVDFFSATQAPPVSPVFRRIDQKVAEDGLRQYVFVLPKREDIRFEVLAETITPAEIESEWETLTCDVGGVLLSGGPMRLEVEDVGQWTLHKGDSFYIKAGFRHRATNRSAKPLKLITIFDPPRY